MSVLMGLLAQYVPYDPGVWRDFWDSVMTTIGSTVNVGFVIFIPLFCIGVFIFIIRQFF